MRALVVSLMLLISCQAFAQDTFLLFDLKQNKMLAEEGDTQTRMSPCSTFKVAIALMGYETGLLQDVQTPEIKYKPEYTKTYHVVLDTWKQDQTPRTWLKHSCVWYSQVLTRKMGLETFETLVNQLNYGNRDISGDEGKNNGLTHCWLSSSIKISPAEQLKFLSSLYNESLPLSTSAQQKTKEIMLVKKLDEWTVYGKTGSGYQGGTPDTLKHGWFVGWIEKGDQAFAFVYLVKDEQILDGPASFRAKDRLLERIKAFTKVS